jgi:N-acetylglutamate synthase-like GNAT family acetyltransferase
VIIRKAATEDAGALTRIAHDAKRHWGYPEHWIQHWQDDLTISPEFISTNDVFVAETDDGVVGFYALILREQNAELDHMWVTPAHIGSGVGKLLFLHAMDRAAAAKVKTVGILSDPNAEPFYLKMGAHRTGESVSEIDGEPRVLPRLVVDPSAEN